MIENRKGRAPWHLSRVARNSSGCGPLEALRIRGLTAEFLEHFPLLLYTGYGLFL